MKYPDDPEQMMSEPRPFSDDPIICDMMMQLHAGAVGYAIGLAMMVAVLIWEWF